MYARGTILSRREPFPVADAAAVPPVDGDPRAPYNRVRVIGPSPRVVSGGAPAMWSGVSAQGVVIEPLAGFGGIVDRPLGELQADYDIESEPEVVIPQPSVRVIDAQSRAAGPTPEEVFAEEAAKAAKETRRGRGRAA